MDRKNQICFVVFLMCTVGRAVAMEAPGARSPIGSPTQVPSAHRTGAIPNRQDLYGYVGNLTVTGNIGGGRHFRGIVPYGSSYYVDSGNLDPGRRAVNSFLRRSVGYEPYFDPSRTVTSLQRGSVSGLSSPTVSAQGRSSSASHQWLASFDVADLLRPPEQRPLAPSPQSVEAILDRKISTDFLKRSTETSEAQIKRPGIEISKESTLSLPEIPAPPEPIRPGETDNLQEHLEKEKSFYQTMRDRIADSIALESEDLSQGGEQAEPSEQTDSAAEQTPLGRSKVLQRPEDVVDPSMGRIALKGYPDYSHLARAKTDAYLAAGEQFLKEGQYYRAADAFELASVWDRDGALPALARSHALFAAGEYMSSAYYLSEALSRSPELVEAEVNWDSLLKTRDDYENRLVELSTWQQRSNSPELAFLMGYVLFKDGKLTRARISAEYAQDMMPDHAAADILQKAIEKALNPQPAEPVESASP